MNEDFLTEYHATDPSLINADCAARSCFDLFQLQYWWVEKMRKQKFETFEFMVLTQFIMIDLVAKASPDISNETKQSLLSYKNSLFKALYNYYVENFQDYVKRLDILTSIYSDFQVNLIF
uniref:NR LBD domain-containing protein n=1 Tax=Acrobeloides nanus TaxID=290746 RepID=A0A914CL65_9BILA